MGYRWSDNDRCFGPFIYARENGYRRLGIVLVSGTDEYRGCRLRMHGFGHTLIVSLPPIIRPYRRWVDTSRHTWSSAAGGYWEEHSREFGFIFVGGALHLDYGEQTHDSSTDKSKCYFLPWREWRHVRRSFYGLNGEHVATLPDTGKLYLGDMDRFRREQEIADATPSVSFEFEDYDGERIIATTRIEEREWHKGAGRFKWLSWFTKPKIARSLDISFSAETGRRKGSWKGGTVGHSIGMLPGELHIGAFLRYCNEHDMTFVGAAELTG